VDFFGLEISWKSLLWGAVLFFGMLVGSLVLLGVFIVRMPADYLTASHQRERGHWSARILKNIAGIILILLGILMSIPGVPGQGFLTVLIGLMLTDFPGKRRLELWIVHRPGVLPAINKFRARYDKPPLVIDD
jgi:hypothetical protein